MAFFHCDTNKFVKKRKQILWLCLMPLCQGALIMSLITIINLRTFYEKNYLTLVINALLAVAVLGTLIFFLTFYITERAVRRNARMTYFEIGGKSLIFSKYKGRVIENNGKAALMRSLYVLNLKDLKSVGCVKKSGRIFLEAEEDSIREYYDKTERLQYRLISGLPEFESWWYNENGYKNLSVLEITGMFGNNSETEKLCEKIAEAKRCFDKAPEPRPYIHKEPELVKRRKVQEILKKINSR